MTGMDLIGLKDIGGNTGSFSLSPDGRFIAFQLQRADFENRTYAADWFVVQTKAGASPRHVGSGGDPILNFASQGYSIGVRSEVKAKWSPDGLWIAYPRKDAGAVQLWRSRADGSQQTQLTHNPADVIDFDWAADGHSVYFEAGRDRNRMRTDDQAEADRGYLLDDRFAHGTLRPFWYACEKNPREPIPESQACVPALWVIDLKAQEERPATGQDKQAYEALVAPSPAKGVAESRSVQNVAHSPNGSHTGWLENEKPVEFRGIYPPLTLYIDGKRCEEPECHGQLRELWWDHDRVVFLRREGHAYGQTALYVWTPGKRGSLRLIYRGEDKLESCEIADGRLICLHEAPTVPRRIVSIDIDGGKFNTVFDPNPKLGELDLGTVERLEWRDAFGNPTYGHLVLPPGYERGKRYPLVIVQYRSRGFLRGGVGDEFPIFPLAAEGFVVLSFDCPNDWDQLARLDFVNDNSRATAETLKDEYEQKMDLSALEIVIDQLDKRGVIDPARVGITGLSHGADNVQYALTHSVKFAAAAASGAWAPSMYFYLNSNAPYRAWVKTIWKATAGSQLFENVDKVATPLLLQVSDSELLAMLPVHVAFKDAGKPVDTYVFPDEYHIKWQPQHKLAVGQRAIDWLRFWLQDYEDVDPAKADQYRRWRAMR